jgi:hypothetical protein
MACIMKINIIVCGRLRTFGELVQAFTISLQEMGHTVSNVYEKHWMYPLPVVDNRGIDVNLYIGVAWRFFEMTEKGESGNVDPNVLNIAYNTEQWDKKGSVDEKKWVNVVKKCDVTIDMFKNRYDWDTSTIYCPVGWSSAFEIKNLTSNKNIDIYHIGSIGNRDKRVFQQYDDMITSPDGWGSERNDAISRSKIHLILRLRRDYEFPQIRGMFSMCNKVFTLTNRHDNYGIYELNKHLMLFKDDDFEVDTKYWLDNETIRTEFAVECYNDIKKNHKFTMYLERA